MPEGTFSASYDATTKAVSAVVCLILSARVHAFRTGHRRQAADREHSGTAFLLCLCAQYQRAGRYLPACSQHPAKMFPELARRIVPEYSTPGQVVLDPLAGIGTTLVEAALVDRVEDN